MLGHSYNYGLSQFSVSRCIQLVTNIINDNLSNEWIVVPTSDTVIINKRNKFNIARCLGVIDDTHISVIAPPTEHPIYPGLPYYNRKGYYSINCQIICDSDLNIRNMNARFSESIHDATIWRTSFIRSFLENKYLQSDNSCI